MLPALAIAALLGSSASMDIRFNMADDASGTHPTPVETKIEVPVPSDAGPVDSNVPVTITPATDDTPVTVSPVVK